MVAKHLENVPACVKAGMKDLERGAMPGNKLRLTKDCMTQMDAWMLEGTIIMSAEQNGQ